MPRVGKSFCPKENLRSGYSRARVYLNRPHWTGIHRLRGFIMLKVATRLSRNDGDSPRARKLSLENRRRHLSAQIAVDTLLRYKIFPQTLRLSDSFFETWWLCHEAKSHPRPTLSMETPPHIAFRKSLLFHSSFFRDRCE